MAAMAGIAACTSTEKVILCPANGAKGVDVDTHLTLTFSEVPTVGTSGWIRIYDVGNGACVDSLDLSVPAGPTESRTYAPDIDYTQVPYDYSRSFVPTNRNTVPGTPSGTAEPTPPDYQLTIIGGFTDAFHFHPVLVRGTSAIIYPHNNVLEYGHQYRVTVDEGVFPSTPRKWTFSTKDAPPSLTDTLLVDASGAGDFCTLQGALDLIPDFSPDPVVIKVMPGDYEEIVYVRNKAHVTILGSGADVTRVHYANNEVFNPHPMTVKTNERAGTFPQRRAAVAFDHCNDLILKDITFATDLMGQAEGLFLCGDRIALSGGVRNRRRRRHHPRPRQPLRLPKRFPQPRRPFYLGPQLQACPWRRIRGMHVRKHHRHPCRLRPLRLQSRIHLSRRRNGPPRLPCPQPPPPRLECAGRTDSQHA